MSAASTFPDSKVHVANIGPTWVLSAPGGPHVCPMNLAIRVTIQINTAKLSSRFQVVRRNYSKWFIKCRINCDWSWVYTTSLFLKLSYSRYIQHMQWRKCLIMYCESKYIQRYWFSNSNSWNIYMKTFTCALVDTYHIDQMQGTIIYRQILPMYEFCGLLRCFPATSMCTFNKCSVWKHTRPNGASFFLLWFLAADAFHVIHI